MSEIFTAKDLETFKRACILGLSRHPLPKGKAATALAVTGEEAEPLTLLAMMAQYTRFMPPKAQPRELHASRQSPVEDPRPTLPEAARAALGGLLMNQQQGQIDSMIKAVLDRQREFGYRLHPFDLPRLAGALRRHENRLGPAERAYLRLLRPDQAASEPDLLEWAIGPENWTEFPRATRLRFLRDLRASAPEQARGLIESCFASEAASLRADLVETLQIGLSDADRPFLEGLNKDRARTVKERAQDLLAHIRRTTAYEDRLSRVLEILVVKKGLLNRRETLTVKLPATKRGNDPGAALRASLSGIWLTDLCRGLELSFDQLLDLLAEAQEPLAYALMACALAEGRLDALSRLTAAIPDFELQPALEALDETLWRLTKTEQAEVIHLLFTRVRWDQLPPAGAWEKVQAALDDDALAEEIAEQLTASPAWRQYLKLLRKEPGGGLGDPLLATIVPLLPPALGPRLLGDLENLTLPRHDPAVAYAAFLTALDAAGSAGQAATDD